MNRYAVIGKRVRHSKSPAIFKILFDKYNIDAEYGFVEADITDEKGMKNVLLALDGANITAPYKFLAARVCDKLKTDTGKYKAVNTIVRKNGLLVGYNTDIYGVLKGLESLNTNCSKFLLLGVGGAAVAAAIAIKKAGGILYVHNRTLHKAEEFAGYYDAKVVRDIQDFESDCVTIVNTVSSQKFVYEKIELIRVENLNFLDAIYPSPSYSLHKKIKKYISGEKWLVAQALESFKVFAGVEFDASLQEHLERSI